LGRYELAALMMLACLIAFGLAASGLALLEALMAVAFLAGAMLLACAWQSMCRQAGTRPTLTRQQRCWNTAVFLVWALAMVALTWWYTVERAERPQRGLPPSGGLVRPQDLPGNTKPEQPPPNRGIWP